MGWRKIISTGVILVQLCALATVAVVVHGRASAATDRLHITGMVIDQSGGDLAGASVVATDLSDGMIQFGPVVTAADGSYELDVDPGTYDITFTPLVGSSLSSVVDKNVVVQSDKVVDARLTAASGSHTFSGVLTDQDGNPIPHFGIVLSSASGQDVAQVFTDATGRYSMSVPAGVYTYLKIRNLSSGSGSVNGADLPAPDFGNPGDVSLNLATGDVVQDLVLHMVKLNVVSKDSSGNPIVAARVTFNYTNTDLGTATLSSGDENYSLKINSINQSFGPSQTDANGKYTLLVPQGGVYTANNPAAQPLCLNFPDGTNRCDTDTINATSDMTIELDELPTHTLSGVVTDQAGHPIANLNVQVFTDAGVSVNIGSTNSAGHYTETLPAGTYDYVRLQGFNGGNSRINGTDITNPDFGNPGDIPIDVSNGDLVKNFALNFSKLNVVAKDSLGNPMPGTRVFYEYRFGDSNQNFGKTPVTSGTDTYSLAIHSINLSQPVPFPVTGSNGVYTVFVPTGGTFVASNPFSFLCLVYSNGSQNCVNGTNTFNSSHDTTIILQQGRQPVSTPLAPTGVVAASPTNDPVIGWDAVPGADSYNIYRNGVVVGTTTTDLVYTDDGAPEGNDTYFVTAVNAAGESQPSDSVSVLMIADTTPPVVTYTLSPSPNSAGWNNSDVTVTFTCSDPESGIQACRTPIDITAEGTTTVTGVGIDNVGIGTRIRVTVNIDKTAPTISYSVSPAPNSAGWNNSPATVTFSCQDMLSGIASCSAPVTVSTDGSHQTVTGTATDLAGNTTSITARVNIDQSVPMVGTPSWSDNPLIEGNDTTLTAPANPTVSPITNGEYYIGDTDPGEGNGSTMTYDDTAGDLTATFGSGLTPGTYQVHVRAENAAGLWGPTVATTLVVKPSAIAPTITSANNYSIGVRQIITPGNFTVTTTGAPAPNLTESGTLPAGLTFTDNGDGTANFTGMVAAGTAGTYHVTITATNSAGSVSQNFTLTITNTDSAPTTIFTGSGSDTLNANVGTAASFTFTATGNGKNSKIFVFSGTLPPGLSLHDSKDGTATFFGTPTHTGTYTFTLEAQNKNGITYRQFTVVVS